MANKSLERGSANVYQFPPGGRAGVGAGRAGENAMPSDQGRRLDVGLCSGSWYHEAAIEEAKPKWEH